MDYSVQFVNEGTINQALALLRGFFGKSYFGADDKYVKWQYFDSPFKENVVKKNEYPIIVFLDEKDTILTLDAFLPWMTYVDGKELTTIWDIQWINFSKIKGLGKELVKLLREKAEIYCGYGMNQLSLHTYEKLGYSTKNEIERKIAILDAQKCIELFGNNHIKGQKEFLMESEVTSLSNNIKYFDIETIEEISERYWFTHTERCSVTSFKDIRTLKWRYFEHPYIDYKFIALDAEAKAGLAVVRLEKIRGRKESVLRILELFPMRGYEGELVNAVLKFGLDQAALLVDFFCVSQKYCDQICPSPFIFLSEHRKYEVPRLFQPIEVRERKSINMVLDYNAQHDAISFDNFYATKGDGDQDALVNENYRTVSL